MYSWRAPDPRPPRRFWMRQLSARGGAQMFSSMGKRAGVSATSADEAQLDSTRAAGHLFSTGVPPRWRAEVFCGVFDYGEEETAVSAGAASFCRRCLRFLSRELLRQSAEAARPAGATRLRRCVLKGLAAWRGGGAMSGGVLEFDICWEIIASRRTAAFM